MTASASRRSAVAPALSVTTDRVSCEKPPHLADRHRGAARVGRGPGPVQVPLELGRAVAGHVTGRSRTRTSWPSSSSDVVVVKPTVVRVTSPALSVAV